MENILRESASSPSPLLAAKDEYGGGVPPRPGSSRAPRNGNSGYLIRMKNREIDRLKKEVELSKFHNEMVLRPGTAKTSRKVRTPAS